MTNTIEAGETAAEAPAVAPELGWVLGFDTETTGPNALEDRIVTAAVVLINPEGEITQKYTWLANPEMSNQPKAAEVHGITDEMAVRDGMDEGQAVMEMINTISHYAEQGVPVAAYNAPFDFTILTLAAARHHMSFQMPALIIDPFVIDKQVDRYRRGKRTLTATTEHYGVELDGAHEALADAVAAARLAQVVYRQHSAVLPAHDLMRLQADWKAEQSASFQTYLRRHDPEAVVDGGWPLLTPLASKQ